jgi:hypothetical protein
MRLILRVAAVGLTIGSMTLAASAQTALLEPDRPKQEHCLPIQQGKNLIIPDCSGGHDDPIETLRIDEPLVSAQISGVVHRVGEWSPPGSRFFSLDGEVYPPFIEPRIADGPSASMGPLFLNPYPTTVPSISFAPGVTF